MSDITEKGHELLAFLVSSAVRLPDEPEIYGPLRLMEAARRLCDILIAAGDECGGELEKLVETIDEGKHKNMTDRPAFFEMIDSVSEKLVDIL